MPYLFENAWISNRIFTPADISSIFRTVSYHDYISNLQTYKDIQNCPVDSLIRIIIWY